MSISWLATALVLACAFPLMVSARAANVTVVNGTTLYAETKYNLYELSEGRLTIYFRSPNGEFRATNRFAKPSGLSRRLLYLTITFLSTTERFYLGKD